MFQTTGAIAIAGHRLSNRSMGIIGIAVVSVVMCCAVAGALASLFDSEQGLGKEFLAGLHAIGYIFVPVAGIMAAIPLLSHHGHRHQAGRRQLHRGVFHDDFLRPGSVLRPQDKVLNIAFAVCAAFLFGDHLAFTANFQPTLIAAVMLGKLCGGAAGFLLAYRLSVPKALQIEKQRLAEQP